MWDKLPVELDRYVLHEKVGSGGMGAVFRATMRSIAGFEKTVALKCILPHLIRQSPKFAQDLISEAKLSVLMNHPNIIQVYDLGEIDGTLFVSMEFVDGWSFVTILSNFIADKKQLPVEAVCSVLHRVCTGLSYAHNLEDPEGNRLEVVHRDISPHNILISNKGGVKIIDFGIAKASTNLELTDPGLVKGKVPYMAPEQLGGQDVDHRTDVFAAGIVLFEALTCERLFGGTSKARPVGDLLTTRVPKVSEFRPDVPPELEAIVEKALQRDPNERYQTADEFGRAVAKFSTPLEPSELRRVLALDKMPIELHEYTSRTTSNEPLLGAKSNPGKAVSSGAHAAVAESAEANVDAVDADAIQTKMVTTHPGLEIGHRSRIVRALPAIGIVLLTVAAGMFVIAPLLDRSIAAPTPQQDPAQPSEPVTEPVTGIGEAPIDEGEDEAGAEADSVEDERANAHDPAKAKNKRRPRAKRVKSGQALTAAEVEAAVAKRGRKFGKCIRDHFDPQTQPEGQLTVKFKILGNGRVAKVDVNPDVYRNSALGACIKKVGWQLKVRPHPDAFVEIQFPFDVRLRR